MEIKQEQLIVTIDDSSDEETKIHSNCNEPTDYQHKQEENHSIKNEEIDAISATYHNYPTVTNSFCCECGQYSDSFSSHKPECSLYLKIKLNPTNSSPPSPQIGEKGVFPHEESQQKPHLYFYEISDPKFHNYEGPGVEISIPSPEPFRESLVPEPFKERLVREPFRESLVPELFRVSHAPEPFRVSQVPEPFKERLVREPYRESLVPELFRVSHAPEPFRVSQVPEPFRESPAPEPFRESPAPEPFKERLVREPYRESLVPELFRVSHAPEPFRVSHAPEPFRVSQVPEPFRESPAPEPFRECPAPEPFRVSHAPEPFREYPAPKSFRERLGPEPFRERLVREQCRERLVPKPSIEKYISDPRQFKIYDTISTITSYSHARTSISSNWKPLEIPTISPYDPQSFFKRALSNEQQHNNCPLYLPFPTGTGECSKNYDSSKAKPDKPVSNECCLSFSCEFCPKQFSTKGLLNAHTFYDCKNKQVVCQKCFMRFTTNTHLMRHQTLKRCYPKPEECKACKNRYKNLSALKAHMKRCAALSNSNT